MNRSSKNFVFMSENLATITKSPGGKLPAQLASYQQTMLYRLRLDKISFFLFNGIRLIKDKNMNRKKGFGFFRLQQDVTITTTLNDFFFASITRTPAASVHIKS